MYFRKQSETVPNMKSQITLGRALLLVVACSSVITVSEAAAQKRVAKKLSSNTYEKNLHEVETTNEKDKQIVNGELIGDTTNTLNSVEIKAQEEKRIKDDQDKLKHDQNREMFDIKNAQKSELDILKNEKTVAIRNLNNKHNAALQRFSNTYHKPTDTLTKLKRKQEEERANLENSYNRKIDTLLRSHEQQIQDLEEEHKSEQKELERSVQQRIDERNQIRQQEDGKKRLEIELEENLAKLSNEDAEPKDEESEDIESEDIESEETESEVTKSVVTESKNELLDGQNVVSGNSLGSNPLTLKPILDVLTDIRQLLQTILNTLLPMSNV